MTAPETPASAAPRRILSGAIVSDGRVLDSALLAWEGDRILYAGPAAGFDPSGYQDADRREVPAGSFILPGLVDVHCHGANGGQFSGANEQSGRRAVDFLRRSGTTTMLAS